MAASASAKTSKHDTADTRAAILDAAIACVKRWGIEKVTLNDIAREANVTRPTVYSYFSSRDEVVRAALMQSAYGFVEQVMQHLAKFSEPAERLIEAFSFALQTLPDEPYLALVTNTEMAFMVNEHTMTSPEGWQMARGTFRFILTGLELSDAQADEFAEFALRLLFSLLMMESPVERNAEQQKAFIARCLLPALGLNANELYGAVK